MFFWGGGNLILHMTLVIVKLRKYGGETEPEAEDSLRQWCQTQFLKGCVQAGVYTNLEPQPFNELHHSDMHEFYATHMELHLFYPVIGKKNSIQSCILGKTENCLYK